MYDALANTNIIENLTFLRGCNTTVDLCVLFGGVEKGHVTIAITYLPCMHLLFEM